MMLQAGAVIARWLVSVLGMTWRIDVVGGDNPSNLRRAGKPFVFALWHADLMPLIWFHRGDATSLVISEHRDGGYLAKAARAWGYGIIRGSSTRGAKVAFREMLRVLRAGGEVAITPDGPRGPVGVVKGGAVAVAQSAGVSIIPVAVAVSSYWRLRSWDRFLIPKPFAHIRIAYDGPLELSANGSRAAGAQRLQRRLEAVALEAQC